MEACANDRSFVEWEEQFVSQEKGNRVVHYYFKDSDGNSILAVVGTERSLRHMVYVVSDDFSRVYGSENSMNTCSKWRSRREVVNWLTSLLSKKNSLPELSRSPANALSQNYDADLMTESDDQQTLLQNHSGHFSRKLKGHQSDIMWSGTASACGKQLKHYQAFSRNGTTVPIHSFVLVMAEEENHYLAYLEDMYEDKKKQKKVKVRWFHQNQEVVGNIRIPPPVPHPKEVFITPYAQVISAECVDGLAVILTPEHYKKCLDVLPYSSSSRIFLCFRQFRNNKVKAFNLSKLPGYFDQTIFSCLNIHATPKQKSCEEDEDYSPRKSAKKGQKRPKTCRGRQKLASNFSVDEASVRGIQSTPCRPNYQNVRFGLLARRPFPVKCISASQFVLLPFKVDDQIEILCQDSGIRGCWFQCTVLEMSRKQIKVQYDDLQDEDGCGSLEEWIPAFREAAPDKLGLRCEGRLTVRPRAPRGKLADDVRHEIGSPVDAWWNDGWWEGVVAGVENHAEDAVQVYFPGEELLSVIQKKNLRISRDWYKNQWIDIESKPDILSVISAVSPGTKLSICSMVPKKAAESDGSAMPTRETQNLEKELVEVGKEAVLSRAQDLQGPNSIKRRRTVDKIAEKNGDEMDAQDYHNDNNEQHGKVLNTEEGVMGISQTFVVVSAS